MTAKLLSIRNDLTTFCLGVFAYIDLFSILLVHLFIFLFIREDDGDKIPEHVLNFLFGFYIQYFL